MMRLKYSALSSGRILCHWPSAQTSDLAPVVSKPVSRTIDLPGEILPFLTVSLHAKVPGYVERVLVDRGSMVKQGDLLVELSAPELKAQIAEAESKVQAAEAEPPAGGSATGRRSRALGTVSRRPRKRPAPWPATSWFWRKSRWTRRKSWCAPAEQASQRRAVRGRAPARKWKLSDHHRALRRRGDGPLRAPRRAGRPRRGHRRCW